MAQETSHYTVLARRFRPQQFDEVVGQQHVAQSLQNAIRAGRVAHAYLFTGARGVGKTSMARILAKALNCPNATDAVPCNQCEICSGISAGNDVDISEIDGASNRGIDDIRSLRANVNVKSMRTKYKVYIVDEVHMLTREAFNALLKTLEEPPPGVKFVFCTTEPNKVPDTILSRCQRFDFSSINTQRISERLTEIAAAEGVEVEPAAVELVARRAAGSMRDSQSLFDQLLAFGGDKLTSGDVHKLLGTADDDRLIAIFAAIVNHDAADALTQFDKALEAGVQPGELINQLLACGRDLMVLTAGAESLELIGISESNRAALLGLGKSWGIETVIAALQILGETRDKLMRTTQSRALAELSIVRLAVLEDLSQISALLSGGITATAKPAAAQKKNTELKPAPVAPVAIQPPVPEPVQPVPVPTEVVAAKPAAAPDAASVAAAPPLTIPKPTAPTPQPAPPAESEPAKISEEEESSLPQVEVQKGNESNFHAQLIDSMKDTARDHIKLASLAITGPNQVALRFSKSYHFNKKYCERPEILGRLQKAASKIAGKQIQLRVDLSNDEPAGTVPQASRPREPEKAVRPEEDAFLQEAVHLFRATVVRTERL
jgi:DNA polymerase-3 subunit gamma/tau